MEQKLLIRSAVPSPLTRGHWVVTLACGHLHSISLLGDQANEALEDFWNWYHDPNCKTITPTIRHLPAEINCRNCDKPKDWSKFDFYKNESEGICNDYVEPYQARITE